MLTNLRSFTVPILVGIIIALLVQQFLISRENPGGDLSFNRIITPARAAVVNIGTLRQEYERREILPFLFSNVLKPVTVLGSGVIIDQQGYILTNYHVIQDADEISVGLFDGRQVRAVIIGVDPETDLAVLKVDLEAVPFLPLSADANTEVGEIVFAIGNGQGLGQTVSMGIISAQGKRERRQSGYSTYSNFIQTDATINPGNSGGALINTNGELIAINSSILTQSGGSEGIAFSIPAYLAQRVFDQILKFGRVRRGWLGVEITGNSDKVIISGVFENSPAQQVGLMPGDQITKINQTLIMNGFQAMDLIANLQPEQEIVLQILRDNQTKEVKTRAMLR